ncbi:Anhydromuropeptide permease [Azospirillaceae bacterium]
MFFWLRLFRVYLSRRMAVILALGFSSGLPLMLTGSTLGVRLAEDGVSKTSIGLFAMVGLPYSLKFIWAPVIDRVSLPFLTRWFGRRRGWALFWQCGLLLTLVGLGGADIGADPMWFAWTAVAVAFCSASQDIVLDAYRVESLDPARQGAGAALFVLGYRVGMLASGAGALYLAAYMPWSQVYWVMAGMVAVGTVTVLCSAEPPAELLRSSGRNWFSQSVIAPFSDFMQRPSWIWALLFIALFRLGDVLAGAMSMPFYLSLGYDKIEIANVTKVFGLIATIGGGIIGGAIVHRLGLMRALLLCGAQQMLSNLMFVFMAWAGHDLRLLVVTVAVENVTGGMATAAFVAYISGLCSVSYTATQYALLTSFVAFARDILAASGGWMADHMSWPYYFLTTVFAALPGLSVLLLLYHKEKRSTVSESGKK